MIRRSQGANGILSLGTNRLRTRFSELCKEAFSELLWSQNLKGNLRPLRASTWPQLLKASAADLPRESEKAFLYPNPFMERKTVKLWCLKGNFFVKIPQNLELKFLSFLSGSGFGRRLQCTSCASSGISFLKVPSGNFSPRICV